MCARLSPTPGRNQHLGLVEIPNPQTYMLTGFRPLVSGVVGFRPSLSTLTRGIHVLEAESPAKLICLCTEHLVVVCNNALASLAITQAIWRTVAIVVVTVVVVAASLARITRSEGLWFIDREKPPIWGAPAPRGPAIMRMIMLVLSILNPRMAALAGGQSALDVEPSLDFESTLGQRCCEPTAAPSKQL